MPTPAVSLNSHSKRQKNQNPPSFEISLDKKNPSLDLGTVTHTCTVAHCECKVELLCAALDIVKIPNLFMYLEFQF